MAAASPPAPSNASSNPESPQIFPSTAELAAELLAQVRSASTEAIAARGVFHVALSGGSLPATLAEALLEPADASGSRKPRVDVSKWHWWFADERCVKRDDSESNFAEAHKKLFKFLPPIASTHMHAIDESKIDSPAEAAAAYEVELRRVVPDGVLDLLLLGMGPDGHCCSLFPGHPLLQGNSKWIESITDSPKPPPQRITFTFALINQARASLFVITGSGKADSLNTVMKQRSGKASEKSDEFLPSARVRSQRNVFLVDKAAAEKLDARL